MRIEALNGPLSLRNSGFLELVFIGVGSAFTKSLYNTNFLIIKGDDHVMVDFGMTAPVALNACGLDLEHIQTLLPTHSHCDHIGGIEQLALWKRYVVPQNEEKRKLNVIITEAYERILWNMSLRGGMEWNEVNADGTSLNFRDYFTVIQPEHISDDPRAVHRVNIGSIQLELFGTNHIPEQALNAKAAFPTFGLMIDDRVFFSGDTKFDADLVEHYAPRAEVFFHDTAFVANAVHASIDELRTLDAAIRERMYLVHYGDTYEQQDCSGFAGLTRKATRYIFD